MITYHSRGEDARSAATAEMWRSQLRDPFSVHTMPPFATMRGQETTDTIQKGGNDTTNTSEDKPAHSEHEGATFSQHLTIP